MKDTSNDWEDAGLIVLRQPHHSHCMLTHITALLYSLIQKSCYQARATKVVALCNGDDHLSVCLFVSLLKRMLLLSSQVGWHIIRDQPNSRFHGRDIFREICLLPWKTPISMKFRDIRDFSWILTLLLSFMKVFRVLSTAFVWMLLSATCHTSALSSWHAFTVLLTYIPPH